MRRHMQLVRTSVGEVSPSLRDSEPRAAVTGMRPTRSSLRRR